jgi:uncharacterized protein (UPF0333 family)
MKKPIVIVIVLVILGIAVWYFGSNKSTNSTANPETTSVTAPAPVTTEQGNTTAAIPVSTTTKVSDKLSEFKNEELGLSVKYPSAWEKTMNNAGVAFTIPNSKSDTNTVGSLGAKIVVTGGKCAFPPVTTVKDRSTLKSGTLSFNMISMSNSVQGTNYFDRIYSLQKGSICYTFSFSSTTFSPASKGYKGSEATQMTNNNKALVESADQAFTTMVKSFTYVVSPAGQDETTVVPTKK